jgi:uncharacterized membrane protein YccC
LADRTWSLLPGIDDGPHAVAEAGLSTSTLLQNGGHTLCALTTEALLAAAVHLPMPKWSTPRGPQLRYCAKLALATVAAYLLTLGERNEYALYSVLGAALVMGGSVGEDLNTSLNRVRGTLAGAVVGIVLAYPLGMSVWSLGISVAMLAWVSIGLGWGKPALRAGIAMAVVGLFTHSSDAVQYGIWRVLNTVIGVSIGVAVSRLVWPVRGQDEVAAAIDRALAASVAALDALAVGASSDALRPLQLELLDTMAELRTARTNARLGQRLDRNTDLLNARTVLAVRAAVDTLGASLKLDELAQAGARAECLQAVRHAIVPLAAYANATSGEQLVNDFATRHDAAMREAAHPDIDAGARALLAGVLSELQQIRASLGAMRDGDSRAVTVNQESA